ncbi:MAG: glutamate 5-kinase [Chloroflexi bacterium HGW-Chloroflexi-2]|jgi:glutamate 5-kinase|nr:MAG: glutamate 5-kinase [Chloroflexi bacterium HGW-Chloroflexi-2]
MPAQRIVIKLGTSTLTQGKTEISMEHMIELVRVIARLHQEGHQVILVSSGAMAVGSSIMGHPMLPRHIPAKQMLAAVGQSRLMEIYSQLFGYYQIPVGQVLLTREDLSNRRRYLNARNTLEAMMQYRVVPVINENDTVSTEEIRLGDNDNLSALVSNVVEADLLVLFTDQDGLFTADPRGHPDAKVVAEITDNEIPEEIWKVAGGTANGLGTGGMFTKIQAADLARRSGCAVVISNGKHPERIWDIVAGKEVGTRFTPLITKLESRKRYMLAEARHNGGWLQLDKGAVAALRDGGSLLPVGITNTGGNFARGDIVKMKDEKGKEFALGMINYNYEDLLKIIGLQSQEIEQVLGYNYGMEVVHHNNLLFL